jgi:CheY-like chemotaxis protein
VATTEHAAVPDGRSKMGQAQSGTSRDGLRIKTILLVEDHDDSRIMLRLILESSDYYVLEAATGPEALKIARLRNPDLILMDIGLPELDGLETIRRIRQIDWLQKTPIVVLSAYSGPVYYQSAIEAGGNYFVSKPIDFDKLKAILIKIDSSGTSQQRHSEPDTGHVVRYIPHEGEHPPRSSD